MIHSVKNVCTRLLFPPKCPACGKLLNEQEKERKTARGFCGFCAEETVFAKEPVCKKCGKPLADEAGEYCADCQDRQRSFEQGKALYVYSGPVQIAMYRLKYSGRKAIAGPMAEEAAEIFGAWLRLKKIEAIVPIPMYRRKEKKRGYNQADVIAKALGTACRIPVEKKLLVRSRNTAPQKGLSGEERRRNLKNAFHAQADDVKFNCILLVDDIFTTGATVDSAAAALKRVGVQQVFVFCICTGRGF